MIKKIIVLVLLASHCFSCINTREKEQRQKEPLYFNLKAYFETEAHKMNKQKRPVVKTVFKDGEQESKKVTIENWRNELELFSTSDINKSAWAGSYAIDTLAANSGFSYKVLDTALRTKSIRIDLSKNGDVKRILILNGVSNLLYHSTEELTYYPDSLYQISKSQTVSIIGSSTYRIEGKLAN